MLRDLLIALSLSNLCFLREWREFLSGNLSLYSKVPPTNNLLGIQLNVLLLATVLWIAFLLAQRQRNRFAMPLARWAFFLLVVANLRMSRLGFDLFERWRWAGLAVWLLLLGLIVFAFRRWQRRILQACVALVLIFSPFLLVTFSQAIWQLIQIRTQSFADRATAPVLPPRPAGPRVLWLVFDEFDQRHAFIERAPSVELPELDRLRARALYASNAYPPARKTELSMPAMMTGKLVSKARPYGSDELLITYGGAAEAVRWSTQPNIFSSARELGFNTAMFGWYHAYCRVIAGSLTACSWREGLLLGALRRDASLPGSMLDQVRDLLNILFSLERLGVLSREGRNREQRQKLIRDHQELMAGGLKAAGDPNFGLVMVHLPAPHPPGIYDRRKHDFSAEDSAGYLDSLVLTDRTVGEFCRALEAAGLWDSTVVLVTSDHWWRADFWKTQPYWTPEEAAAYGGKLDHRIPFLLKLPRQKQGVAYDREFNTVLSHDLVLALLRGELSSEESVVRWLDQHRSIGESPYN